MQAANLLISGALPATEKGRPVLPLVPLLLDPAPELPAASPKVDVVAVARDVVVPFDVVARLATRAEGDPTHPPAATPRLMKAAARTSFLTAHTKARASKPALKLFARRVFADHLTRGRV
jgi:hypothetical protein